MIVFFIQIIIKITITHNTEYNLSINQYILYLHTRYAYILANFRSKCIFRKLKILLISTYKK